MTSKAKETKAAKGTKAAAKSSGLVSMCKDGKDLKVHPTCVAAHKARGWKTA